MTVISAYVAGGELALVSDLLASSKLLQNTQTILPLSNSRHHNILEPGDNFPQRLVQKLAVIGGKFCVGASGNASQAARFISYISDQVRICTPDSEDDCRSLVESYSPDDEDRIDIVGGCCTPDSTMMFGVGGEFVRHSGLSARIIGSGASEFKDYFGEIAEATQVLADRQYERAIMMALLSMGCASSRQYFSGRGLRDGWGGGFEIATRLRSTRSIEKIDRILTLFWDVDLTAKRVVNYSEFIYQFYDGDTMGIWVNESSRSPTKYYSVPSLSGRQSALPNTPSFDPDIVVHAVRLRDNSGQNITSALASTYEHNSRGHIEVRTFRGRRVVWISTEEMHNNLLSEWFPGEAVSNIEILAA